MAHDDGIMMGICKLVAPVPTFLAKKATENPKLAREAMDVACPALPLVRATAKEVKKNPELAKKAIHVTAPGTMLIEHDVKVLMNNPKDGVKSLISPMLPLVETAVKGVKKNPEAATTAMKLSCPAAGILSLLF